MAKAASVAAVAKLAGAFSSTARPSAMAVVRALQFLAACRGTRSAETTRHLLRLGHASRHLMHELLAQEPTLDCAYTNSGKLVVYRHAAALNGARRQVEFQHGLVADSDYRQEVLDSATCLKIEPALAGLHGQIVGGVHTPSEDTADC